MWSRALQATLCALCNAYYITLYGSRLTDSLTTSTLSISRHAVVRPSHILPSVMTDALLDDLKRGRVLVKRSYN